MIWVRALLVLLLAASLRATPPGDEDLLKAQIMVELLPFVRLPGESERSDRPYQLGILGKLPFRSQLESYARSRTVNHRPILLRYLTRISEAEGCDAVFICQSELRRAESILAWAGTKKILTLSDDEGLAQRGVMVNLITEQASAKRRGNSFIRITVNQEAATSAGVFLGSQLLRNARLLAPKAGSSSTSQNPGSSAPPPFSAYVDEL